MKQRELEILLQKVKPHPSPNPTLEQYQTPATIAAEVLYFAHGKGDIAGRKVLDAGCGTGIFAIGAKLLGADEVIALDMDEAALGVAMGNAKSLGVDVSLLTVDVRDFPEPCDTVIQNPPFGSQRPHADAPFLEHALLIGSIVYTFHNGETEAWVEERAAALGGAITDRLRFAFPIPHTFGFHRDAVREVPATMFRIERRQSVKSASPHRAAGT
ncbi:MAG TPA: METTL5 family protein [Thermoplasmata archaeon]|nr:METTL5 family protein [Thermoplasmata archaeon]